MLCNITNVFNKINNIGNLIMAVGKSGRVVVEIDAELKEQLHKAIKMQGKTLKEWFEEKVKQDFPNLKSSADKE
jgi:hypothetical protein